MLFMHTLKYRSKSHVLACFVVPVVLLSLVGCNSSKKKDDAKKAPSDVALQRDQLSKIDAWAVEVPLQTSVENAVIRQRVLYDYHFVDGVVRLTPVGRRDARILAKHYKGTQWELNLKQGRASDQLYQQRLNAIVIMMKANGVALTDLTIRSGICHSDMKNQRKPTQTHQNWLLEGNLADFRKILCQKRDQNF